MDTDKLEESLMALKHMPYGTIVQAIQPKITAIIKCIMTERRNREQNSF